MNIDEMFSKYTAEELIRKHTRDGFLYVIEEGKSCITRPNHGTSWVQKISWDDHLDGWICGGQTRYYSRKQGYKCKLNPIQQRPENIPGIEIESRCAEIAVAKFLDMEWKCHVNKFSFGGDVGKWTQVRHSFDIENGLKVRPGNPLNKPYVQVSGGNCWFLIHGWEWGFKATHRPQKFGPPKPCWEVPQNDLQPMSEFPPEPPFDVKEEVPDDEFCRWMGWTEEQWEEMTRWSHEWGDDPRLIPKHRSCRNFGVTV